MPLDPHPNHALATDPERLEQLFGATDGLLPLWIAEPYLPLSPAVTEALEQRGRLGWYGYETRPHGLNDAFRAWMHRRHGWDIDSETLVSPSLGTSIGAALDIVTKPGDTVILQPPVFTDFKPLVVRAGREVARSPLVYHEGRYTMDFDSLEEIAARPDTSAMILCNPHNPVGRVWTKAELARAAEICSAHNVFVIADEIHADVLLNGSTFTPFTTAASDAGARSVALHGPIKTFGIAGVADTLIVTDDSAFVSSFKEMSSRLHLTRNNVFSIAAASAAYAEGDDWLDGMLATVSDNVRTLREGLPDPIRIVEPEGTYLAWIDFRGLGMDVPALAEWLPRNAKLALSPGHWFGREGAGFARMSIAVEPDVIQQAIRRLSDAVVN
jgi:cystathionine beta-lyase